MSGLKEFLAPRRFDEPRETLRFGGAGTTAKRCQMIEARPATAGPRIRRRLDFDQEPLIDEPGQVSVEHPGPQLHGAAGAFEHLIHDRETVQVFIGDGQQNLEPVRGKGNHRSISTGLYR